MKYSDYYDKYAKPVKDLEDLEVKENGVLHAEGKPSVVKNDRYTKFVEFYYYGAMHREDGPAKIIFYRDGRIQYIFLNMNERDRVNGPASVTISKNGKVVQEDYYIKSKYIGSFSKGKHELIKTKFKQLKL